MVLESQDKMFCGFSLTRKRKMTTLMEADPPYHTKDAEAMYRDVDQPWWADIIESGELADVIRSQCDEKVLLIDCRSFIEFNQCNIVNSINVCCNKIVKRRLQQNKVKIQEFLSSTCHIEIDSGYTVVIYDQSTTDASSLADDDIVTILGNKCKHVFSRVRVLYGGFLEFQSQHPSLLETKTKTPCQQAAASLSQPCMPVTNIGPTKILPYLFLGSMKDALSADVAKSNGVTYVLNVSMTCPKPSHIQDGHFLRIPVNDNYSEKLLPYFHEAFQFIDKVREANGCVLVHCLAGISRSPTLAIAYIMRTYNMSSEEAYRYVKDKRVTISPNFNFLGQLLEYEQQIAKDDNSQFTGSKRRCIDDLRAELSSPSSPVAMPRLRLAAVSDSSTSMSRLSNAHSPTSALSRLKFDHCFSKNVQSPTAAFAKLKFTGFNEGRAPSPLAAVIHDEEPEYMTCYTSNTIHQNSPSADNSPCTPTERSVSLHLLNTNCNNNSNRSEEEPEERSSSPNSSPLRPSRPMSLSLTSVDEMNSNLSIKRPISLGVNILEDVNVKSPTESKTNELTLCIDEATASSQQQTVHSDVVLGGLHRFKLPQDSDVTLRDKTTLTKKKRPNSTALADDSPKEQLALPTTPTKDHLGTKNFDQMLTSSSGDTQRRSRSLEDMISHMSSSGEDTCRNCLTRKPCNKCSNNVMVSIGHSSGSMSSSGSHPSLHGSLELIQVL